MRRGKRLIAAGIFAVICCVMMFVSVGTFGTLTAYAAEEQIEINDTNFPDEKFRGYVSRFDKDSDGYLSKEEIENVTEIDLYDKGIESLQGVEFFTAIEILYCDRNNLTSLDVSGRTALKELKCNGNNLKKLNVSGCTALTSLWCDNNKLKSLDVSGCTALKKLHCYKNKLISLNVSGCTRLKWLHCYTNNLSGLDVSDCTALRELRCYENRLISLDVSRNTALTGLHCESNSLSSLDVSGNTALTELWCYSNNLSSLDVSDKTSLTELRCESNSLNSLNISGDTALRVLWCESNKLSSLDVSDSTALTELSCYENNLSGLDVSGNTALINLWCYKNNLSSLDISNNTALEYFNCSENSLSSLDVSGNTALIYLNCSSNNISSLDVSGSTAMKWLYCEDNHLNSLDVKNNATMTELKCGGNNLSSLDVSSNTALTVFDCDGNTYTVPLSAGSTFDMSTLPGMDVSKVSNITGGTIKGNILTVSSGAWAVTYTYDCGNDITAEFELVVKVPVSYAKVTLPKTSYTYTGSAITPAVTVTYGGKKLTAGTDYTVTYTNNKAVGKATVTIAGKGNYTGMVTKTFKIIPASTTVKSLTNKTKGITIKWKKAQGAGGYIIYRSKNGGKYSRIKTIKSANTVSYTDKSATTNGARYKYKIVAYKKVGTTTYKSASSKTKTVYRISAPKIKELRNKSGKKIAVKWTKNKKATGYQIQYATNSKFKKAKTVTVKKAKAVSKVITKLKKNSTYRVRVRAYKKVSGKNYYSAWSSTKSVKIRK